MLRHTHIDRPFIGILFMLGFCVLAPLGDALAKVLGERLDLGMLVLTRFAAQAAILLPIALWSGATLMVRGRVLALVTTRTLLHIAGISTMFTSLRFLPLADALAIAFVMPFVMLLLGRFVLGEEVGPHRLWASVVGFAGTLLVIQPNFAEVGAPALLPVGVAVIFALFMLVTRQIAKEVEPVALQAVSGLQASAILLPVLIFLPDLPGSGLAAFDLATGWLLLALGAVGTAAHLLMTWSLRFAPASTLAPMQYLEIPFGTVIGWLIFRDLPNGLAALGILVTICAGLYIILRERRLARS
jgi:drug/metabolite transporter (DMT)-like permease